tara:strand:- start:2669 stop:2908 length:240 start_codon:yes stop_codon:yes gene_type:complete
MAGSGVVDTIRGWIGGVTDVAVSLLALAVVLQVLFGSSVVFVPVDVIGNISGLVASLGGAGLVGLITVGVLYWIWHNRH